MADPNDNPPRPSPATTPRPGSDLGSTRSETDDAIDAALETATGRTAGEPRVGEIPLKRQWDAEMEAELEAALSGFDPKTFELATPRAPRSERAPEPRDERGQEGQPGPRTGKVISIRGKNIFVDLGGKSEGILTLDQFEGGEIPQPGSSIEVVIERFDPEEGILLLRLNGAA